MYKLSVREREIDLAEQVEKRKMLDRAELCAEQKKSDAKKEIEIDIAEQKEMERRKMLDRAELCTEQKKSAAKTERRKYEKRKTWQELYREEGGKMTLRRVTERGLELSTKRGRRTKKKDDTVPGSEMQTKKKEIDSYMFKFEENSDRKTTLPLKEDSSILLSKIAMKMTLQDLEVEGIVTSGRKIFEEGKVENCIRKMMTPKDTPGRIQKKKTTCKKKMTPGRCTLKSRLSTPKRKEERTGGRNKGNGNHQEKESLGLEGKFGKLKGKFENLDDKLRDNGGPVEGASPAPKKRLNFTFQNDEVAMQDMRKLLDEKAVGRAMIGGIGRLTSLQAKPGCGVGRDTPAQARGGGVGWGGTEKNVIGARGTSQLQPGQARPRGGEALDSPGKGVGAEMGSLGS